MKIMHTPKHAILFFKVLICCTVLCAGKPCLLFSGTTDQWVQKAGAAVTDLAKGNPQGALYQAAPAIQTPLPSRASAYARLSGAGIRQPLPLKLPVHAPGLDSAYNAGTRYGLKQKPQFYQNVQVSAGNQYLSNTTTVTPPSLKRKP